MYDRVAVRLRVQSIPTPYLAWCLAGLSLVLIAAGSLLAVLAILRAEDTVGLLSHQGIIPFSGVAFAVLGGLVLSRYPSHPIAWILAGLGLITGVEVLNLGYLTYMSLKAPGQIIPAADLAHWLAQWLYVPRAFIPITLLFLLFPDGNLPSRRWRPVGAASIAGLALAAVTNAFASGSWEGLGGIVRNPFAIRSQLLEVGSLVSGTALLIALLACMASVFIRFRRSSGAERQQLKWMTYASGLFVVLLLLAAFLFAFISDTRLAYELIFSIQNAGTIGIAAAASIAVLRYRLYDIDLIINRTLVYGTLTLVTVGLYILLVGSLSTAFQVRGNLLISLAATGVIAVVFQPLRQGLQRTVNRALYGDRDEPYAVLSRLGRRLGNPDTPEVMLTSIVETISQTLKLPYVAIEFPHEGGYEVVCEAGSPTPDQVKLHLEYRGGNLGHLVCAPRALNEPFTSTEKKLLQDIAVQAAVAVHTLQLNAELQRSRERLVSARAEERRRLRRDLHDGLGPQLASVGFKIDAARNRLEADPMAADAILLQLRRQVKDAVSDIRRITYNLRPPALDEMGLIPALRSSAEAQFSAAGLQIDVNGPEEMPTLPAAVEVAAYRIVQEAVTNVARHAHARHCQVCVHVKEGLELEILDDGVGMPESPRHGVGLKSMRERIAELGGSFRVEALPNQGTRVLARIPLEAE